VRVFDDSSNSNLRRLQVTSVIFVTFIVGVTSILAGHAKATDINVTHRVPQMVARAGSSGSVYVLWSATCGASRCYQLARTNNGGRKFVVVTAPPISAEPKSLGSSTGSLDRLVFANALDGYATEAYWSAQNTLYATFDGGYKWQKEPTKRGEVIEALNASPNAFYEVTARCDASHHTCSHWELRHTPLTSAHWTSVPLAKNVAGGSPSPGVTITAYGPDVWIRVDTVSGVPRLATSTDGGRTFTVKSEAVLGAAAACVPTATSATTLWATCAEGNMLGELLYSSDGGARWNLTSQDLRGHLSFGIFDPISRGVAYATDGFDTPNTRRIYRIVNNSEKPTLIGTAPDGYLYSLTFINAKQGLAWGPTPGDVEPYWLWSTQDGGRYWSRISSP